MTRNEILIEFNRLSRGINKAEYEGLITSEEACVAIEAYRERADRVLLALKRGKERVT
jgi:hypothetical protein